MESQKRSFLYLSEEDLLNAGVLDIDRCVDVVQEVFSLLAKGDYLMGGNNHNSHGMSIVFPKETPFPNMPVAGPDRRFTAMPAYLGGRFDVCGIKWYGSNAANTEKGLPRSILTVMLNDKDTGSPLCLMSANLISAMRTGAVPGVAARFLARKDAKTLSVIGCGPINKSCFNSIMQQCKSVKEVYCYDLFGEKATAFASEAAERWNVAAKSVETAQEAVERGDVVTVAASRLKPLYIDSKWVRKGSSIFLTGPAKGDDALWQNNKLVFDHIGLHKSYMEEAVASGDKAAYYAGVIGGPIYTLMDEGKLPSLDASTGLGEIVNGDKTGRTSSEEGIIFVACGMAVYDVAWAYDLYVTALQKGIGTELALWERPHLK